MPGKRRPLLVLPIFRIFGLLRRMPSSVPPLVSRSAYGATRPSRGRQPVVLSSVYHTTGKSKPIFAILMELNDNSPGVVIEINNTNRDHCTFTPPVGQQYTHGISFTRRDPYALQRWYSDPFVPVLSLPNHNSQLAQAPKGHTWTRPKSNLLV